MDVLRFHEIFNKGVITEIITEFAKRYQMGVVLVDQDDDGSWETWLLPAEFLLI